MNLDIMMIDLMLRWSGTFMNDLPSYNYFLSFIRFFVSKMITLF
jgi:hypothetical protein